MFSSLGGAVTGATVCDLFAGSGALGIEALSRGAARATFVEQDAKVAMVLRANLDRAGVADRAMVVVQPAATFAGRPRGGPFDLLLCDPPYALAWPDVMALLASLGAAGALARGTLVVIERDRRSLPSELPAPAGMAEERRRSYGDTVLIYLRTIDEDDQWA